MPKLGLLSNSNLSPEINWSTLAPPLFKALREIANAEEIAPPPLAFSNLRPYARVVASTYRFNSFFGFQRSARLEIPLLVLAMARGPARRATFVVDPWRPSLGKIAVGSELQRLEYCFIPYREAYDVLRNSRNGHKFVYLPFGIDVNVFKKYDAQKDIDIFWMGRRYEPLHQVILEYCDRKNLNYLFRERTGIISPDELGRMVSRSRYFVVTPPDLDNPVRTGGFSPLVMRYFEGLAGGSRLLGVLPKSGEFQQFLPREAILEVQADGSDFIEMYERDRNDKAAREATYQAHLLVQAEHSWRNRAETIWSFLDK